MACSIENQVHSRAYAGGQIAPQPQDRGACTGLAASFLASQLGAGVGHGCGLAGHGESAAPARLFTRSESPAGHTALQGPHQEGRSGHSGRPLLR